MQKLFNKKLFSFFVLLFCSLVLFLITILPLVHKINHKIEIYTPLLKADTPTIHLFNHRLKLNGEIPKTIELANGIMVYFDVQVNDSLINASPAGSVFIAEDAIKIKTKTEIKEFNCSEIEIDKEPIIIEPLKVKGVINSLSSIIMVITGLLFTTFTFMLLYLAVAFSAGIGLMIDTFRDGPYSFTFFMSLSSLFLLAFILAYFLLNIKALLSLKIFALIYLLSFIAVSYGFISFRKSQV
jgi:hypothetical protein